MLRALKIFFTAVDGQQCSNHSGRSGLGEFARGAVGVQRLGESRVYVFRPVRPSVVVGLNTAVARVIDSEAHHVEIQVARLEPMDSRIDGFYDE